MRQRGRRSAVDLEVTAPASAALRLDPPDHLTATEQKLFREVLANTPSGQFSLSDTYLLATFCQVTCVVRQAARSASTAKPKDRQSAFKMLAEAAKCQSMIATKLRLVPSARTSPRSLARASDAHRPSAYDTREWEFLDDNHSN
jgi:phage terminase small subunit